MTTEAPKDFSPAGIKAWISSVSARLGSTPTQLARRAKVAPSTINKFLADPDPTRNINARTIESLVAAATELFSERSAAYSPIPVSEEVPFNLFASHLVNIQVVSRKVKFVNNTITFDPLFTISVPVPEPYSTAGAPLFAVQIMDDQASPTYPAGSVVILRGGFGGAIRTGFLSGERVLAGEVDALPDAIEMFAREIVESPGGDRWLVGLPAGKSRLKDMYLGRQSDVSPNIHIFGQIIMSLQPEPAIYGGAAGDPA